MSAKHTPGPWLVDGNVIRGDAQINGSVTVACVLDVAYPYGRWAGESAKANARLIAAAPDLLDALQWLVDLMPDPELDIDTVQREQVIKAKAVIAKATGGQA